MNPYTIPVQEPTTPVFPVLPILDAELVAINLDDFPGQELRRFDRNELAIPETPEIPPFTITDRLYHYTIEDPYWIIIGVLVSSVLGIMGCIGYGIYSVVVAVAPGASLMMKLLLIGLGILLLAVSPPGRAVCKGLHCAGCGSR